MYVNRFSNLYHYIADLVWICEVCVIVAWEFLQIYDSQFYGVICENSIFVKKVSYPILFS